ncbi:MAG: FtsX-like permease family protein [Pseudomonadota bacterium]
MEFGPIFRALLRNKIGAVLIALQIAFTMTVSLNAWVMIQERMEKAARPSGMDEANTFHFQSYGFTTEFNNKLTIENDLRQLRELPGVVDAVQTNAVPLSGSGWSMGFRTSTEDDAQAFGGAVYMLDEHGIDALGVKLIAGENFTPTDVRWRGRSSADWPPKAIISRALAKALYPDEADVLDIVGKSAFIAESPFTIIGIMETLQAPWSGSSIAEQSVIVPQHLETRAARYIVRTEPGQRDSLMPQVEELLASSNSERIIRSMETIEETRRDSYQLDMGLAKILGFVMAVLILITGLGILGLASFSVSRRTKQIGIRRALGATTSDILRYFLVENMLITFAGVVLGAILTVALNIWLVDMMNFPKISWYGIPLGMVVLMALGQLAVLGPANNACRVSPATATRTV